jgi:hypothetical protein
VTRLVDIDDLTISQRDELGALLREEARRLRRTLTEDAAWGAFRSAPVEGTGWATSVLIDVGRVRVGTRRLMTIDGWKPHQIREAMLAVALHVAPDPVVAEMAVDAGIEDGLKVLGSDRCTA